MKKYIRHFKPALLAALIAAMLLTISGCGGKDSAEETFAPDTSKRKQ